jgi:hypothetical protein
MDKQTLHDSCERAGVARQSVEQGGVTPRIAHRNRSAVPIDVHLKSLS